MNAPTEPNDPKTEPPNELSLAILEATIGLKEAAHSLSTLTQKTERAQKPASFRRGLSIHAGQESPEQACSSGNPGDA